MTTRFWDFSLGMESSAMLWVCRDEILECGGHVIYADTGKQFPEAYESLEQIEGLTGLKIERCKQDFTFDEFLLERGGMLKQGYTDCSRRMKRVVLKRAHQKHPYPWEINLGYNADESQRAYDFSSRNDVEGKVKWRYPLIEKRIDRGDTVKICEKAGFTILLEMYRKMGRMDCYLCPNQTIRQAQKVMRFYPELWKEWKALEKAKGHAFLSVSTEVIEKMPNQEDFFNALDAGKSRCSCFGGEDFDSTC
jgi:3'-phosphoadenosine 5'-phosphosulfate sulfotransferase (PAPS reductase)/FAD synthetase